MGTICPACGKLDDRSDEDQCPHCGAYYAKVRRPSPSTPDKPQHPSGATRFGYAAALIVVGLGVVFAFGTPRPGTDSNDQDALREARTTCLDALPDLVRYPATLEVSRLNIGDTRMDNGNILLDIPFTAQNAFGVPSEHNSRCQTSPDGTELVAINVLDR